MSKPMDTDSDTPGLLDLSAFRPEGGSSEASGVCGRKGEGGSFGGHDAVGELQGVAAGPTAAPLSGLIAPVLVLEDRFELARPIAEGGMGTVWLARDRLFGVPRAVKLIRASLKNQPKAEARFLREAKILQRFQHPRVVEMIGFGVERGHAYIVMELVAGRSVDRLLTPGKPMPLTWVVSVLHQLCEVLRDAHTLGIIHRDLKPSNLMMVGKSVDPTEPGSLKLLDFGIARVHDSAEFTNLTQTDRHGPLGTLAYASPEQILRGLYQRDDAADLLGGTLQTPPPIDHRSDLYSVGVMLYRFLSGQRPFQGDPSILPFLHLNIPPRRFTSLNPPVEVPEAIERVVLRCLAKKPEDRPQSAWALWEEFAAALREAGHEKLVWSATPAWPHPNTPAWSATPPSFLSQSNVTQSNAAAVGQMERHHESESPSLGSVWIGDPAGSVAHPHPPQACSPPTPPSDGVSELGSPAPNLAASNHGSGDSASADDSPHLDRLWDALPPTPTHSTRIVIRDKTSDPVGTTRGPRFPTPTSVPVSSRETSEKAHPVAPKGLSTSPHSASQHRDASSSSLMGAIDEALLDSGKLVFRPLPPGLYRRGAMADDLDALDLDRPRHWVRLTKAFQLGIVPVTQRQYENVMGINPSRCPICPNAPVDQVSWCEAIEFCNRLSRRRGLTPCYRVKGSRVVWDHKADGYRLPTEAEWEYACRAGSRGRFPFDGEVGELDHYAWYRDNSADLDAEFAALHPAHGNPTPRTHPVARKRPNAYGLYDMLGNVAEWCWDWIGPYPALPRGEALTDPIGPAEGDFRVLRGGSYASSAFDLGSARRGGAAPTSRDRAGLRVCRTLNNG